jgi:hypothetical protein
MATPAKIKKYVEQIKAENGEIFSVDQLNNLDAIFDFDSSFSKINFFGIKEKLRDEHLVSLLKLKSSLREISFEGCKHLTDEGIQILSGLTLLENISFDSCEQLTDVNGFLVLLALAPSLRKLNLRSCNNVKDSTFFAVLGKLPKLEEINLQFVKTFSVSGLQQLSENLFSLKLLGCEQLDDSAMKIISTKFKNLRELHIAKCKNISMEGLKLLVDLPFLKDVQVFDRAGNVTTKVTLEEYQAFMNQIRENQAKRDRRKNDDEVVSKH